MIWEGAIMAANKEFKTRMNIRIIFTEELLGGCPNSEEIYSDYIANKASDVDRKEEIKALGVDESIEQGTTKFLEVDGKPALSNHVWLGYLKEKIGYLKGLKNKELACTGFTAYKKKLDLGVSFGAKFSILVIPNGGQMSICQRSLRAQTMQGERIALASSITVPARSRTRFTLVMPPEYKKYIIEALDEGRYEGTGQWRGSGKKGTFLWEEFDDDKNVIGGNTKEVLGVTTKDEGFNDALVSYITNAMVGETEEAFD
jgi:hypothetical protein